MAKGRNDNGYPPLLEVIARRYGVAPERVTSAQGASGANFLVCAALLSPGDDVLVERPAYDPLMGAPRLFGARVVHFDRLFDDTFDRFFGDDRIWNLSLGVRLEAGEGHGRMGRYGAALPRALPGEGAICDLMPR